MPTPSRRSKRHRSPLPAILAFILLLSSLAFLFFWWKKADAVKPVEEQAQTSQSTAKESKSSQTTVAETTSKTEQATWTKQDSPVNIPILMYHAIHDMAPEEAANANLIVAPDVFESHIKALKEAGYYFLTPEETYRALTENSLPAKKVVWLTFDDSLWDFYAKAYPILTKYQAKATNNVITGTVGNQGNLSVDQMLEMKEKGFSFQGHTVNHPDLEYSSPDSQTAELSQSKEFLDQKLNQETIAVAYPAGRYSQTTLDIVSQQHYKLGVTTHEGLASAANGLLSLNRVRILPNTTAESLLARLQ